MVPIRIRTDDGRLVADQAWLAQTWGERARGWLGKDAAAPGEAILLDPATSIHSFGMRFAFDLAFLDKDGKVLQLCHEIKPNRLALGPWRRGVRALELPAGTLRSLDMRRGQVLKIENL